MTRLLSIGLDGAAWHKLDRLIERGALPNLARLAAEGARGPLRSVTPPVTCPAWRCSTAGKRPGKLGVYWWLQLDREQGRLVAPDARSFDTTDVWDYLGAAGYRSAIVNVPMTYPPPSIEGGIVAGFGAPFEVDVGGAPLARPPSLRERLDELDWQVGVDDVTGDGGVEAALDVIRSRFELLLELLEEGYDYLHLTVFYLNVLQHKFGDGPETERAWRLVDEYLGKLPDDVTLLCYSDHGHGHVERTFSVNAFLADRDSLTITDRTGDAATATAYRTLQRVGISPHRVANLARRLLPAGVTDRLIESGYPIPTSALDDRVDWAASDALAVSQGPVYLNRERLGDDYERVRADLREALLAYTAPDGSSPIESVQIGDELYDGPHVDSAPDLFCRPADGWELYGGITPEITDTAASSWTSGNDPVGMILLHGPDVRAGELSERSLVDVMPTVLRYFDCPVPTDCDGTAIREPFTRSFGRDTCEPIARKATETAARCGESNGRADASSDDEPSVSDRLEDLGYLE